MRIIGKLITGIGIPGILGISGATTAIVLKNKHNNMTPSEHLERTMVEPECTIPGDELASPELPVITTPVEWELQEIIKGRLRLQVPAVPLLNEHFYGRRMLIDFRAAIISKIDNNIINTNAKLKVENDKYKKLISHFNSK